MKTSDRRSEQMLKVLVCFITKSSLLVILEQVGEGNEGGAS